MRFFIKVLNVCLAILDAVLLGIAETFIRYMWALQVKIVLHQVPVVCVCGEAEI
jgi:hypothetical protein